MMEKVYIAIDLKSFYASCECVELGLDPLDTNLVVADESRTEKTICLAVSPSLKSYGIPGRARLYEVVRRVETVNAGRAKKCAPKGLTGKSCFNSELMSDDRLAVDYIVATPRMSHYMKLSSDIYAIYLKYVSPDDIFAYSVDEVFIDATAYLGIYNTDGHGFARMLIQDVLKNTGITATAGIGSNMYLCKVAMDIVAKHIPADKDGVRIAELDEEGYKNNWWSHTPITDFWRVGRGIAKRLEKLGMYTMGDVACFSLDRFLVGRIYKEFGKNAELLIDHAWGIEPTTIADVKAYKPQNRSITSGQVLSEPCGYERTRLIVWEMADMISLDLVDKKLLSNQMVLTINYDRESLEDGNYKGEFVSDYYGRTVPKAAHGTINLDSHTSSTRLINNAAMTLFDRIFDKNLLARRINLVMGNVIKEDEVPESENFKQLSLFDMMKDEKEEKVLEKERALQEAVLAIKHRYGKNAMLKGTNYTEGATAKDRNRQIGGHKA